MNENLISRIKRSITIPPAKKAVFLVNVIAFSGHSTGSVEIIPQLCGAGD